MQKEVRQILSYHLLIFDDRMHMEYKCLTQLVFKVKVNEMLGFFVIRRQGFPRAFLTLRRVTFFSLRPSKNDLSQRNSPNLTCYYNEIDAVSGELFLKQ